MIPKSGNRFLDKIMLKQEKLVDAVPLARRQVRGVLVSAGRGRGNGIAAAASATWAWGLVRGSGTGSAIGSDGSGAAVSAIMMDGAAVEASCAGST